MFDHILVTVVSQVAHQQQSEPHGPVEQKEISQYLYYQSSRIKYKESGTERLFKEIMDKASHIW